MYDTVNMVLTQEDVRDVNFLEECAPYLDTDGLVYHERNGQPFVTGQIGNLGFSINPNKLWLKTGSICKWMLGDNYQRMTRLEAEQAIERLSDRLHIPMERAIVTRLDVGLTIPVNEPVANYLCHLGTLKYGKRFEQPDSVYYYRHGQDEVLHFYDKNKQQREAHESIPEQYKRNNMLRYEHRYKRHLPKLLGVDKVTAEMLYDVLFFSSVINRWAGAFREINKINDTELNFRVMRTSTQMSKMAMLALIEKCGGVLNLLAQISECQKKGVLTSKVAYGMRRKVSAVSHIDDDLVVKNEAIAELDCKISEATEGISNYSSLL